MNVAMTLQFGLYLLVLQYLVFISQLKGLLCYPIQSHEDKNTRAFTTATTVPTIFDSRVLDTVKTLFTRNLLRNAKRTRVVSGQKKSIIETAVDAETGFPVKIDAHQFGQALLVKAAENANAARKSDIYMNKAIDATALGVAVLKLIFGKDTRMVMKDSKDSDIKASLRANQFRPGVTSWSIPRKEATGERKSLPIKDDTSSTARKSDKIAQLNLNILKLVKSLQPVSSHADKNKNGDKEKVNVEAVPAARGNEKKKMGLADNESNLARLLVLIKENEKSARPQTGEKKSWVLLKVPTKQPQDELGMLSDPIKVEQSDGDDSDHEQEHRHISKIQPQRHLKTEHKQQSSDGKSLSSEGKSLTSGPSTVLKTLKSEPVQEVNAVKTDNTAHVSYEDSVKNLLDALEATRRKSADHAPKHFADDKTSRPLHHERMKLIPSKKIEVHAASKDDLTNGGNPGGAVVSLDALRQLGQLLGLSSPHSNKISPYTGTADTLTPATPFPPQALTTTPAPTPPTAPTQITASSSQDSEHQRELSLNRISEQLKMFAERGLKGHNEYRGLHHAEPLKWSEDLASAAEKLAYQAAKKGATTRSELVEKKGYGENVAKISNIALENAGEEATRHWYNEREHFTFSDPRMDVETQAFTQVIWKDTKTLGMGAAKDDDTGELYVVALYYPKGNNEGTLRENVQSDGKEHTDVYASIFKKSIPVQHE